MPSYLYLFRGGELPKNRSPEEMQKNMQKWFTWIEGLRKSGNYEAGDPLQPGGKLVKGKKKVVTDGPYAEAKDLVGGFLKVTASTLDEAVELSRGCPIFEVDGEVEVRQVQEMHPR